MWVKSGIFSVYLVSFSKLIIPITIKNISTVDLPYNYYFFY